ncbi:MAG: ZIP family metal transporter [Cyclobacteriaceae bacterium]|nr:ZIP family metal transporter [Cyclobacteriaceae bacterium]
MKMLILFLVPLLAGLVIFIVPKARSTNFKLLLVFAGSYLFAITVIHILPELYRQYGEVELIGLFVLLGFFLQQFLEYFTSGVEHGHIHTHEHAGHAHSHTQSEISALVLLAALCVHAFLEGGMVAQGELVDYQYDMKAILLGIAMHRAPAAFALMAVLSDQLRSKRRAIPYLLVFSLAAPLGLFISEYFIEIELLTQTGLIFLYAIVSGNFLHISTTIVFESSPDHHFNARKLAIAILGSLLAVVVEFVI